MNLRPYRKLIVALVGAALVIIQQVYPLDLLVGVTADQALEAVVPLLTAFGVWAVPNET
ncbi:hypothetical protein T8K17_11180 [Thalassobaculum sp. OXR-137]|uniref:hypothetical protein n=1 Tax=Thalassobaculum sp. OXR-137 TaxID=3100173 RepID=UPI002AC990E8|nr:hypothetical protein [Thalassobaculum sp. OXR-137]WPZ36697.1 hypothetical protein T8K17_11180 [Thalassobaculum sp. OXR-137]